MITVLHNDFDAGSRRFVGELLALGREDVQVINWYNSADLQQWIDAGGTLQVCAFPTVIVGEVELITPTVQEVLEVVNGQ